MNIMYLKYVLEIEKTGSISKAAENLYMGQPNLSRAVKELEDSIGVNIFKRSSKGIEVTPDGAEFIQYAKKIIYEVDELENIFKNGKGETQKFSISVPRASYVSDAFAKFSNRIDLQKPVEFFYKETNSSRAITNIIHAGYNLGIIRYQVQFDNYFKELLKEKSLEYQIITDFSYVILVSKDNLLAQKETIVFDDLEEYIEIAHGDPYIPSLPFTEAKKKELSENINKRIFVFERGSQFTLLEENPHTFMWVSPIPQNLLDKYNLVQKKCLDNKKIYRDILVYRKGYRLNKLEKEFVEILCQSKRESHIK